MSMNRWDFLPARARRSGLAYGLRTIWLVQLLVLMVLARTLVDRGHSWLGATAIVVAGWWLLQLGLLGFGFGLKLVAGDWPRRTRGSSMQALRTAAIEMAWMVRLYLYDHVWRQSPEGRGADDRRSPLLLVHGFLCNGSVWRPFARYLPGRSFAAVSLEPTYRHFQQQLDDLNDAVQAMCASTGRERLLLVGHSMGGLLIRAYAERHPERCAGVLCVAAPHHGTLLADYIYGVEAGPPSARCKWLNTINQRDGERIGVPALNLWTADDNIVIPAASAQLRATPERTLHGHGHLAAIAAATACPALLAAIDDLDAQITKETPA